MSRAASDTLEKVSAEFEAEVLADLQEGRGQALALVESAKRGAAEAAVRIVQAGERQAESLKRQIVGAAELKTRNAQLKAVESAVNAAFISAVRSISKTPRARYEKCVVRLIKEGIEAIGPVATVSCNSRDRKLVAAVAEKLSTGKVRLALDPTPLDAAGGIVLAAEGGAVRFDNTIEARLERMKPTLRKDVAAFLTGNR